jgi:hypothetical protein
MWEIVHRIDFREAIELINIYKDWYGLKKDVENLVYDERIYQQLTNGTAE